MGHQRTSGTPMSVGQPLLPYLAKAQKDMAAHPIEKAEKEYKTGRAVNGDRRLASASERATMIIRSIDIYANQLGP